MSKINRMKSCIDRVRLEAKSRRYVPTSDSNVVLQQIFEWTRNGQITTVHEFKEILAHARETISRNGKRPYNGNEDPEITMA